MKKLLVMAACLALIITLSVTGTLAFKAVGGGNGKSRMLRGNSNVSTFAETGNNVAVMNSNNATNAAEDADGLITQTISYRDKNDSSKTIEITPTNNDPSQLLPAPGSENLTALSGDDFWTVNGLDRIVTVTNNSQKSNETSTQSEDDSSIPANVSVYVRTIFAFANPSKIVDNYILLNYNADENVGNWEVIGDATIESKLYKLFVYTYKNALEPGGTTQPSLKQVVLKAEATNEDVAALGGKFEMKVVSEAVESSVATSAADAFEATFGTITTNYHPWMGSGYGAKTLATTATTSN